MKQRPFHAPPTDRPAIAAGRRDRPGNAKTISWAMSARAELARLVLHLLSRGDRVPTQDALQLRNWAPCREDAMLPLEEIACRILSQKEDPTHSLLENEEELEVG